MANEQDIKKLADVLYASQTTGVSSAVYNEALSKVGFKPDQIFDAHKFLNSYGYRPGDTAGFYENSKFQNSPMDEGLKVHHNAVQTAIKDYGYLESTEENLKNFAGKIDPKTGQPYRFMINDGGANRALIASSGVKSDLVKSTDDAFNKNLAQTIAAKKAETYDSTTKKLGEVYGGSGPMQNALQWANLKPLSSGPSGSGASNSDGSAAGFGQSNFANPPTPDPIQNTVTDAVTIPVVKPTYGQAPMTPQGIIQRPESGTFSSPLQTAGLSAVPDTITVRPQYTGTTMANLTMPSQGQQNIQSVMYGNDMGQTVTVTEINGQPTTYVPPGFKRMSGQLLPNQQPKEDDAPIAGVTLSPQTLAKGGSVAEDRTVDAMYRMASQFLGYKGPKTRKGLEEFAKSSPGAASKMKAYTSAMAKGGLVKGYAPGGMVTPTMQNAQIPATPAPLTGQIRQDQLAAMSGNLMRQTLQPIQAPTSFILPQEADFIAPTAGMTVPQAPFAESATVQNVEQASLPQFMTPATFTPTMAAPAVAQETANLQAAQGQVSQGAQIQGAQQVGSAVSNLEAAQGEAIKMNNPMQREIQAGELISGSTVDATKVEALNSQMQAAEATPSSQATVQGQLEGLMTQFEGGKVPAWAAGAMRGAMAQLSARGLGASSLAGQAVVQAAMESAIPIAQVDAQTRAQFESQNLSNRQQTAMMAAQQRANFLQIEFDQGFQSRVQNSARIADIANMNFTAEQQIALENSRNANTVNLQNLGNRQAMTMAEAASLANLDMANLNNRQQAAVQNAQNFLQMDLTNLNNEQQTELFKTQQNIQSLFTDQAAENASLQFNAASENQTKQFFSNLTSQVGQFNATQRNAMDQFNVNSVNAMRQFNSEVQQQRDLFNAQNGLVIAQANAQWRQNIATLNTSAQNQSNMDFAKTINGLTAGNLDQVWQRERDIMSYSFAQSESRQDRALSILLADKDLAAYREKMARESEDAKAAVLTRLLFDS